MFCNFSSSRPPRICRKLNGFVVLQGKLKPIPPPLPLPPHVKGSAPGEVLPSPGALSPRKAILKRSVDDGMERSDLTLTTNNTALCERTVCSAYILQCTVFACMLVTLFCSKMQSQKLGVLPTRRSGFFLVYVAIFLTTKNTVKELSCGQDVFFV